MQTSYSVFPVEAYAGQLADPQDSFIASYVCSEDVKPGVLLELNTDGTVRAAQGTGSGLPLAGVSVLQTAASSTAPLATNVTFKSGDVVPVLRRGRIWANFNGGSPDPGASLNVKHSSTVATYRGFVTGTTTSTGTGTEIAQAFVQLQKLNTAGDLALIDVNYPAIAGATGATGATGPTGPTGPTG